MALSYGIYGFYNDAAREGRALATLGTSPTKSIKSMSIKGPLRHLRKRRGTPRRYNLRELQVPD